jgi:hypothetical protein
MSTKQIDLYLYPCVTALHKFAETNGKKNVVNIKLKKDLHLYPYMTALHKFAEINGKKKSRKYSIDYY